MWITLLRKGLHIPLLGGNDAHGDFNRYRATSIPFLSIYEGFERFMGYGKTGIYGKKSSSIQIMDSIRNGATFITTGPFISINNSPSPFQSIVSNVTISSDDISKLFIYAKSTAEFGRLLKVGVYLGTPSQQERPFLVKHYKQAIYEITEPISIADLPQQGYLRAEVVSVRENNSTFEGYSSPCYFNL